MAIVITRVWKLAQPQFSSFLSLALAAQRYQFVSRPIGVAQYISVAHVLTS